MKVGIIQLTSKLDYKHNLEVIKKYLKEANEKAVKYVFLPECFYSMSDGKNATPYLVEQGNEHFENIRNLAKEFSVYLLGGTAATNLDGKVINRCYNFDPDGNDLGYYDKIHLFSCDIKRNGKRKQVDEGDIYARGDTPNAIKAGELNLGLCVCFDLRFSYMAHDYRLKGVNALTYSSAFTVPSGRAHWHTLVRARAIENQCFVFAAGQWGENAEGVRTYGHSLIVDPWGEVLADAGEGEKLIFADIKLDQIQDVRDMIHMYKEL